MYHLQREAGWAYRRYTRVYTHREAYIRGIPPYHTPQGGIYRVYHPTIPLREAYIQVYTTRDTLREAYIPGYTTRDTFREGIYTRLYTRVHLSGH